MLGNKNALVILWTGNDIPDHLIGKIGDVLVSNNVTIPEMLKIVYKDQEGLSQCLIREANGVSTIKFDITDDKVAEAIRQAIIYIGKRFEASLTNAKAGNLVPFALELQSALSKARSNASFNILCVDADDKALINAVELIATTSAEVPASFAKKWHFSKSVVDVIKQIHNQFA
jgi:hypothetical protein